MFGAIISGAGTVWLLDNLGFIRFNPAMIGPVLLIGFGVALLVRNLDRQAAFGDWHARWAGVASNEAAEPGNAESMIWQWAFFGGSRRAVGTDDFRGGEAMAVFGGVNIDLRKAQIKNNQAVLDCTALFGGIDIKVPEDWVVILRGNAVFGRLR